MEIEKDFDDTKDEFLTQLAKAMKSDKKRTIQMTFKRGKLTRPKRQAQSGEV